MTTATLAPFAINGRRIGPGHPVYVIAEISSNHGQRFEAAVELVHGAHAAGADAVKLQTYTPDTITIDADAPAFVSGEGSLWEGTTSPCPVPDGIHAVGLAAEAQGHRRRARDRTCFSAPFDPTAVDFLEAMDVPAFKIASFELVDLPLIRMVARTGRPMIMSTGMATDDEIDEAVAAARDGGATDIALLKCSSAYPSPPESVNLRAIPTMAERWGVPIGLSDHTKGVAVPAAAVALGATLVEKHVTLSHADATPDEQFSLDLTEFADDGRRHPDRRAGDGQFAHRADRRRGREPAPAALAVRGRGRRRGRAVHGTERALDPAGGRDAHPRIRGRARPTGRGGDRRGTPLSPDLLEPEPAS